MIRKLIATTALTLAAATMLPVTAQAAEPICYPGFTGGWFCTGPVTHHPHGSIHRVYPGRPTLPERTR